MRNPSRLSDKRGFRLQPPQFNQVGPQGCSRVLLPLALKYAACRNKNRGSCFNRHAWAAQTDLVPALRVLLSLSDAAASDTGLDLRNLITIIDWGLVPEQCGRRLDSFSLPAEPEPLTVHLI
ncbi:hypothetical protein AOLI_G00223690 [Acnodon oligacanthus]